MYQFYKSKVQEDMNNNELHEAILNRDVARCRDIIHSPTTQKTLLNQRSLGNTPAMLALKTGLIEVVSALIEDTRVNINLLDSRGFSLLHYACFFREERLITTLLARQIPDHPINDMGTWPPGFNLRKSMIRKTHPFYLYSLNEISPDFPKEIVDSEGFCIFPLILTDLLFHVDKLCLNYGIKQESDFMEANEMPMSSRRFSLYAEIGLEEFLTLRNQKPVNEEIKQLFQETLSGSQERSSHHEDNGMSRILSKN